MGRSEEEFNRTNVPVSIYVDGVLPRDPKQAHAQYPSGGGGSAGLINLFVITILSLVVLRGMRLNVFIRKSSPDTANELKSIALSLVFIALGIL